MSESYRIIITVILIELNNYKKFVHFTIYIAHPNIIEKKDDEKYRAPLKPKPTKSSKRTNDRYNCNVIATEYPLN